MRKFWSLLLVTSMFIFLEVMNGCRTEKLQEIQGEVVGVELVQGKPGGCGVSIPDHTVVGLKTADGALFTLDLTGLHPEIHKGKKYKIRYATVVIDRRAELIGLWIIE